MRAKRFMMTKIVLQDLMTMRVAKITSLAAMMILKVDGVTIALHLSSLTRMETSDQSASLIHINKLTLTRM